MAEEKIKEKPALKQRTFIGGAVYAVGSIVAMSPTTAVIFSIGSIFPVTIPMIGLTAMAIGSGLAGWGYLDFRKAITKAINK